MKRFSTTYSSGQTVESSSPHEAFNFVNYDDAQQFFLSGKLATAAEFYEAAANGVTGWKVKKLATHKRVRVLHGSSVASYVEKWVRK